MKLLIAGGGTGGHLYPGLAVASELKAIDPRSEVWFLGTSKGIEARVLPGLGYCLYKISISGLLGKSLFQKIAFPFRFMVAVMQSLFYMVCRRPDTVLGTGGYVSAPPVLAAWLLRIPVALLALDVMPSQAVRFLARFAREIYGGFQECSQYLPQQEKVVYTGNPIRPEFGSVAKEQGVNEFGLEPGRKTILVFGGSQGAHSLNLAMLEALDQLERNGQAETIQAIFQTGKQDFGLISDKVKNSSIPVKAHSYIDNMPLALAAADLVVSRSGAGVSETLACGRPSILVPFPYAASNHQEYNALSLVRAGAAVMIKDRDLEGGVLARRISELLFNQSSYKKMSEAAKEMARPGAAGEIAKRIINLTEK
jgi:UDP-N-acetylglucosamine--N-acetylmuramyl-(pentapeptide) pyrophosphoryl-undecaprenol N-acetylglucosamine transferase